MPKEENENNEAAEEKGSDLFEEVFGEETGKAKPAKKAGRKEAEKEESGEESKEAEEEKEEEEAEETEEHEEEESEEEEEEAEEESEQEEAEGEESEEEEKPARKKRQRKAKIRAAPPIEEDEKKKQLRAKIKRIVVAKASKAAKQEELLDLDKEAGVKEVGVKEGEPVGELAEAVEQKPELVQHIGLKPVLSFLQDDGGNVFIGRKKSVAQKYGSEAALFVGEVSEEDSKGKHVFLDSLNPHVVFICGARGSGKSYLLGIIAEELALHNRNVGVIVVDPVGVFWSMRFPNRDEKELQLLAKWNLLPQGLENIKVFVPTGIQDKMPKNTFDAIFSIPPALLTTEDWCLTFGIDRFSPSGLLMEKSLFKVKSGYKNKEGKQVKGKKEDFSLDELITCLQADSELSSSEMGYKADSIRALVSRFDAAKAWGIFDEKGTPLGELSRENQLTIIDTSFLEDNVSALVIGILARRILAARKISTRQESAQRFKEESDIDKLLEFGIPPTWLLIDEAHTLIPSGNIQSPASSALIEYVKQGRQPGCSIVFATQQPSAINSKVLSQLDLMVAHKLVFDDDIKAIYKRTPTIVPKRYRKSSFIKTLPIGVALVGDRREETSRAFILRVRPRMSQHEGRESETAEREMHLGKEKVLLLAVEIVNNKLRKSGRIETGVVDELVKTLNAKYNVKIKLSEVLGALEENGAIIDGKSSSIMQPGAKEEEEETAELPVGEPEEEVEQEEKEALSGEEVELLAFPANVKEEQARAMFNSIRKKKFLGLIGEEEGLDSVQLRYLPVFRVELHAFGNKQAFHRVEAFINSVSGEFMHFLPSKRQFVESKGLQQLNELSEREIKLLLALENRKKEFAAIVQQMEEDEAVVKRTLRNLLEKGYVKIEESAGTNFVSTVKEIDLPSNALHPLLSSLSRLPVENATAISLMHAAIDRNALPKMLKKLWQNAIVKKIDVVYLPVFESFLKKKDGTVRRLFIEAVTGKRMELNNQSN
ncbi:MAG: DUF853 family protein [Candidatus Diapherotrites archaeon]|nr:DUF853 family protein [Candidatus Diapherotrites archaeon]